jgi:DhnA family fructose-bisphosphate aldolase class Ia
MAVEWSNGFKAVRPLPRHPNNPTSRLAIVPLDHGVHDGPIPGLIDLGGALDFLVAEGVDGVVLHKGMIERYRDRLRTIPVWLHLSASSHLGRWPLKKVLVAAPDEAMELGASGVSMHVNLGNEHEPDMLSDLGTVATQCRRLQLPLLAMMYVRHMRFGRVVNVTDFRALAHAARVAAELGASVVKVPYTGDPGSFSTVTSGCPVPVVIAGGAHQPANDPNNVLDMIKGAIEAGAAGISMGRNIFQDPKPCSMLQKVKGLVYGLNASDISK